MITYPYEHFFTDGVSVQTDIVITDGTASYSGTSLVVTGNTVLFTNENIHQEQMSLLETLCSENTLHFGSCEACEFKFTISSDVLPLEGKVLNVYLYFDHDASTLFQIGVYKVASDVGTAQRSIREITCYDALYDVLNADYTDWYNAINYTTINTVKKFRDAFFSHIGITQKSVSLVNDSATIVENRAQAISGVQILRAICEINGRFGHIGRTGQFEYIKLEQNIQGLYPAIDLYPSPTLFPQQPKSTPIGRSGEYIPPLKYEEYEVPSITRLQLKTTEDDAGVTVGVAGTDYVIQGNFLTFGSTSLSTIATNILGEISGVVFQPFEVQMNADLCLEVGDAIRCNDDLTGVEGYVLYRQCVGIQAMRDTFNCHSERSYEQNVNNVSFQFQEINNRTLVLKQDIDGVSTELTEQLALDGIVRQGTYAEQTNTKFSQKVSVEYGNHTTDSFSWDMDITGHTWYKNDVEVMKVDGNGLTVRGTVTGSTIIGSEFRVGDALAPHARISADGDVFILGGTLALFDAEIAGQNIVQFITDDFTTIAYNKVDISSEQGKQILYAKSDWISGDDYAVNVYLGSDDLGDWQVDKLALNASTWVHVGVSSSSIKVGNSTSGTTTNIVGDTAHLEGNTVCVGLDSSYSANVIDIGHGSGSGYTGSYIYINSVDTTINASGFINLNGIVKLNGSVLSSGISISDVDSHYSTSCYYSSGDYYIKYNLEAFNRLIFWSDHSQQSFTLNQILRACGLVT